MPKGQLTPKQERFVAEYLIDLNATQAAIRAGYSPRTAQEQGSRLLSNVMVASELSRRRSKTAQKLEITAEKVLEELALLAFYDPADIALATDEEGREIEIKSPRDIAKLPKHICKAIVGWGWDRAGNFTLKFAPKQSTLNLLGQHFNLFASNGDEALKEGLAALLQESRKRARDASQSIH